MNELSTFILVLDGSAAIFIVGVVLFGLDFASLKNSLLRNHSHNRLIASAAAMLTAACIVSPALANDRPEQTKPHTKHSKHILIGNVAPKDQTVEGKAPKGNGWKRFDSGDTDTQVGAY
jgi:hypothetical protein